MTRAVSTVLDASLCLLLVSASVLTLVGIPTGGEGDSDAADETAELLATTTARVTYEVGDESRTAHDTLAGLLATAAVAIGRDDGRREGSAKAFERAVTERVNRTLRRAGGAQVVARRESTRAAIPGERVVAGGRPPANADVHAAALTVSNAHLTVRTWSE